MYQNGEQLVPFIGILRRQLSERRTYTAEERQSLLADLDFLSLGIGRAFAAVSRLAELQVSAAEFAAERSGIKPEHGIFMLTPDYRDLMAFEVDSFLDGARRSQDGIVCCISRCLSISLRRSFSDLMKSLASGKTQLPETVHGLLDEYWANHGLTLKNYRDATQHHMIVASDARVFLDSEGIPQIHLLLPNNPAEKSAAKFQYESPVIHAPEYLVDEFLALIEVTYKITRNLAQLGANPNMAMMAIPLHTAIGFGPNGELLGKHGRPVQGPQEFVDRVGVLLSSLRNE